MLTEVQPCCKRQPYLPQEPQALTPLLLSTEEQAGTQKSQGAFRPFFPFFPPLLPWEGKQLPETVTYTAQKHHRDFQP